MSGADALLRPFHRLRGAGRPRAVNGAPAFGAFRAALAVIAVGLGSPSVASGQAMRDPSWAGVEHLLVLAQLAPTGGFADQALSRRICDAVKASAERDAPVSVECVGYGDRRLREPGYIALLVHAALDRADGPTRIVLAMRVLRQGPFAPSGTYFGAAPRVARFTPDARDNPDFERAVAASLAELLPWRQGRS